MLPISLYNRAEEGVEKDAYSQMMHVTVQLMLLKCASE